MAAFIVFYDANVLYPAELRNFLMHLALIGVFRARWSADVHEEWISNLLANRSDLTREKLERTRQLMDKAAPDALATEYQHLIEGLRLPDRDDRHVLAAAIHCGASVIVTLNLADFPAQILKDFDLEAQHPDEFILHLFDLAPGLVVEAAENHRKSLKNPPKTVEEYIDALEFQGLTQTASALREYIARRTGLRKIHKKFFWRYRERLRQLYDIFEAHIPFAPLDAADVIAMQTCPFRQFVLRVAPLVAELPQRGAKSRLNGTRGHPSMLQL